jgi:hypothetical protein
MEYHQPVRPQTEFSRNTKKIRTIIPDLKINLISSKINYSNEDYFKIQELVDDCVGKYCEIYPNFFITYVNIYSNEDDNIYQIDESSIEFTYLKEIISFVQLKENEKIFISKEKIKLIKLKEIFEELKLQPVEENDSNISMLGETYRELKTHFHESSQRYNNINNNV